MMNQLSEIANGYLEGTIGYKICHGLDLALSQKADLQWGTFKLEKLLFIQDNVPADQQDQFFKSLIGEDNHWEWLNKSLYYMNTDGYDFFYFMINDSVEGVCITFRPKQSTLVAGNIFYIEYLASAPWNRKTLVNDKKYSKVASTMLAVITEYLSSFYSLIPTFSLHSLPQATDYYENILGMIHDSKEDKEMLKFFELPLEASKALCERYTYDKLF